MLNIWEVHSFYCRFSFLFIVIFYAMFCSIRDYLLLLNCQYCTDAGVGMKQTNVFQAISYFLEHVALSDIETVSRLYLKQPDSSLFTPREIEDFNRYLFLHCLVIDSMSSVFKQDIVLTTYVIIDCDFDECFVLPLNLTVTHICSLLSCNSKRVE